MNDQFNAASLGDQLRLAAALRPDLVEELRTAAATFEVACNGYWRTQPQLVDREGFRAAERDAMRLLAEAGV